MKQKKQKQQNQRPRLWIKIVAVAFCLVFGFMLLYVLERLADISQNEDPTSRVQVMLKDKLNGYGMENNQQLSTEPISERAGVIQYSDRWLVRFTGNESNTLRAQELVAAMRTQIPDIKDFYVMPIPPRIVTETGYEEERKTYLTYIEHFKESFGETAQVVDVLPALEAEEGQYLFFRTEDSWTARGAYYGSRVLCEMLGIEPLPLRAYDEHMYSWFLGSLARNEQLMQEEMEEYNGDAFYYYMLPAAKNRETITERDGTQQRCPVFTSSEIGLNTVVGLCQYAVLEGDEQNLETEDASIMLICDNSGKLLAPYLATYYETVFVVSIQEYDDFYADVSTIMDTYGIENIVWAQTSQNLGEQAYSKALNLFLTE